MNEKDINMTTVFVAEFKHGQPALAKVAVVKETPKTYQVSTATGILGSISYIPNRLLKSQHHVFATMEETLAWLVKEADKHASQCLDKFQDACNTQGDLEDMLWRERQKGK